MATPVTPTFTHLSDTRVMFANVDAANNFFESFQFNITGANLPEAAAGSLGGVFQVTVVTYSPPAVGATNTVTLNVDGVSAIVPQADSYAELLAKVNYLSTYVSDLVAALRTSGILDS